MGTRKSSNRTVVVALVLSGLLLAGAIEMMWALEIGNIPMFRCSAAISLIAYIVMVIALMRCAINHSDAD